jgi:hypothetical protein
MRHCRSLLLAADSDDLHHALLLAMTALAPIGIAPALLEHDDLLALALLDRLAADAAFAGVPAAQLQAELDPVTYTGRAGRQVGEFLEEYLRPLLARARPLATEAGSAEVRV